MRAIVAHSFGCVTNSSRTNAFGAPRSSSPLAVMCKRRSWCGAPSCSMTDLLPHMTVPPVSGSNINATSKKSDGVGGQWEQERVRTGNGGNKSEMKEAHQPRPLTCAPSSSTESRWRFVARGFSPLPTHRRSRFGLPPSTRTGANGANQRTSSSAGNAVCGSRRRRGNMSGAAPNPPPASRTIPSTFSWEPAGGATEQQVEQEGRG